MPLNPYQIAAKELLFNTQRDVFKDENQTPTKVLEKLIQVYLNNTQETSGPDTISYSSSLQFFFRKTQPLPFKIYDDFIALLKPEEIYLQKNRILYGAGFSTDTYQNEEIKTEVTSLITEKENKFVYNKFPDFLEFCNVFFSLHPDYIETLLKDYPVLMSKLTLDFEWLENGMGDLIDALLDKFRSANGFDAHSQDLIPTILLLWDQMGASGMHMSQQATLITIFIEKLYNDDEAIKTCKGMGEFIITRCKSKFQLAQIYEGVLRLLEGNHEQSHLKYYVTCLIDTVVALVNACEEKQDEIVNGLLNIASTDEIFGLDRSYFYRLKKMALLILAKLFPKLNCKTEFLKIIFEILKGVPKEYANENFFYPALEACYYLLPYVNRADADLIISKLLTITENKKDSPNSSRLELLKLFYPVLPDHQDAIHALFINSPSSSIWNFPEFINDYFIKMNLGHQNAYVKLIQERSKEWLKRSDGTGNTAFIESAGKVYLLSENSKHQENMLDVLLEQVRDEKGDESRRKCALEQILSLPLSEKHKTFAVENLMAFFTNHIAVKNQKKLCSFDNKILDALNHFVKGPKTRIFDDLIQESKDELIADEKFFDAITILDYRDPIPCHLFPKISEKAQQALLDNFVYVYQYEPYSTTAFSKACELYSQANEAQKNFLLSKGLFVEFLQESDVERAIKFFQALPPYQFIALERHLLMQTYNHINDDEYAKALLLMRKIRINLQDELVFKKAIKI